MYSVGQGPVGPEGFGKALTEFRYRADHERKGFGFRGLGLRILGFRV